MPNHRTSVSFDRIKNTEFYVCHSTHKYVCDLKNMEIPWLLLLIIGIIPVFCNKDDDEDDKRHYVISVMNFPDRMITINRKGVVRIKDVLRDDFKPTDINVMQMKQLNGDTLFSYFYGNLYQDMKSTIIAGRQLNTLDPGFFFKLVK